VPEFEIFCQYLLCTDRINEILTEFAVFCQYFSYSGRIWKILSVFCVFWPKFAQFGRRNTFGTVKSGSPPFYCFSKPCLIIAGAGSSMAPNSDPEDPPADKNQIAP
jgi:hypothetical protein